MVEARNDIAVDARQDGETRWAPRFILPVAQPGKRLFALGILAANLTVFAIAGWVTPSPTGIGTHRQLGYPACLSPLLTGYPCPTCGMTTSFAHAVRGQFLRAFHAQPAGFALFLLMVAACGYCVRVAVTNKGELSLVSRRAGPLALLGAGVIALGWVYKLLTFVA